MHTNTYQFTFYEAVTSYIDILHNHSELVIVPGVEEIFQLLENMFPY